MRIRISLHADPDPALYFNADPDPGRQTNADPGQTLKSHNMKNILKVGNR
jgi:hypothetical protein